MNTQNKLTGLVKGDFSEKSIKIYQAYYEHKKIRDFQTNDDLKPLIDLVGKWRYYIGIKEELSQEELYMNISFIRENFNELNIIDLDQAINLSLKGDLNVDVEHYQNFSPLYIAKILKAYKEYRCKIIYDIKEKINKIKNTPKEPTIDEKIAIAKKSLYSLYNQRNDKNFHDYGSVTFNFIKRNKLIVFSNELITESLNYAKNENNKDLANYAHTDALLDTNKNLSKAFEKKDFEIQTYSRNYIVKKWLNSFNDKSFDEFINKLDSKMI